MHNNSICAVTARWTSWRRVGIFNTGSIVRVLILCVPGGMIYIPYTVAKVRRRNSHSITSVHCTQGPTGGVAQGLDINALYMALSPLSSSRLDCQDQHGRLIPLP